MKALTRLECKKFRRRLLRRGLQEHVRRDGERGLLIESDERISMFVQNREEVESIIRRAEAFRMDEVALRYAEDSGATPTQVEEHLRELKRYLVMLAVRGEPLVMGGPVDALWHTWMLFSRSYVEFCERVAGRYLHHQPGRDHDLTPEEERTKWATFRALYKQLFADAPPEHIWPGAHQTEMGTRDWWRRKLEKYSRGGKLQACLVVGCDSDGTETTSDDDDGPDITVCTGTN